MKTFLPFVFISFGILLCTSCSSDDDDGLNIDGTYQITSLSTTGCNDPEENFTANLDSDGCFTLDSETACMTTREMIFNNGTFEYTYVILIEAGNVSFSDRTAGTGTYTIDGSTVTVCEINDCSTASVTNNGNTISLSITEDDGCVARITAEKQ
ncbi:MAG: hypothetical protein AAFQ02_02730 [Bacteroidota bacterium]